MDRQKEEIEKETPVRRLQNTTRKKALFASLVFFSSAVPSWRQEIIYSSIGASVDGIKHINLRHEKKEDIFRDRCFLEHNSLLVVGRSNGQ